uniref:RNA-directed DNA polymerase n=1 Tax=Ditylenchus dipsaci TaxID=166011 RepID=A0A915E576_9BILA
MLNGPLQSSSLRKPMVQLECASTFYRSQQRSTPTSVSSAVTRTLFASLNGARFFSKLDLADAYLQIELDEESKKLAVINTHRGLFRYNRLPFGVKSAPGIFQQLMDTLLSGIPGAVAYLDDIIIVGSSIEEHNSALLAVFNRIRDAGLQVRLSKCEFFLPSVKYLGFIVDKDGRRPDPQKTAAIKDRVVASLQAEHEICLPQLPPSIFTVSSNDVSSATFHDETLQEVLSALQNGWPEDISPKVMPYYNRRNGLSALDGCILYVDRLIIPQSLRLEVLRLLHESHPGIVRMKSLARQHVYWPGIDSDIEHAVRQCSSCAVSAKSPPNVSVPWPPSKKPWSRIHIDFAQKGTQMFLVVVDSFSKWPEIILVSSATSSSVIKELLRLFSAYGLPEIIVSDNGRQFKSSEFAGSAKLWGHNSSFSSPQQNIFETKLFKHNGFWDF